MAAQNQTYEELLDLIQLSLQRMIDILKTPPPASAHEPPSPASAATTPTLNTVPPSKPASKSAPSPSKPTPTHNKSSPRNTNSSTWVAPPLKWMSLDPPLFQAPVGAATIMVTTPVTVGGTKTVRTMLKVVVTSVMIKKKLESFVGATERHEWHPPWHSIDTSPNATGRLEWWPPWHIRKHFASPSLKTRIV
ncbi:hypothetical protein HanIR_Chr16g0791691 [Helianthus annuus]|nr:hypothetical protein HanIR_Chr16g0791691 [Helianthus annuus]